MADSNPNIYSSGVYNTSVFINNINNVTTISSSTTSTTTSLVETTEELISLYGYVPYGNVAYGTTIDELPTYSISEEEKAEAKKTFLSTDYILSYRSVVNTLGDFWTEIFKEKEVLDIIYNGTTSLYSIEYFKLLDNLLHANLLDIPTSKKDKFKLFMFRTSDAAYNESEGAIVFPLKSILYNNGNTVVNSSNIKSVDYLANSIVDPTLILKKDTHYTIDNTKGTINFNVDLFNDENISRQLYNTEFEGDRYIILWSSILTGTSTNIYDRVGRYVWKAKEDSEEYRYLISLLVFFFTNIKSINTLETIINSLFGIPFTKFSNEVVQDIYEVNLGWNIDTDLFTYFVPDYATLQVQVGNVLSRFTSLGKIGVVMDYRSNPDWYKWGPFPVELLEDDNLSNMLMDAEGDDDNKYLYNLFDSILKYNIFKIELPIDDRNAKYLKTINEAFEIINTGTPVYLYPFIEFYILMLALMYIKVAQLHTVHIDVTSVYNDYKVAAIQPFYYKTSFHTFNAFTITPSA